MYKTIAQRKDEERQTALLWLFLSSRGLLQEFTQFCRERRNMSLDEVDKELRILTTKQNKL